MQLKKLIKKLYFFFFKGDCVKLEISEQKH